MTAIVIWMIGIGVSAAALVVTAALKLQYIHMALTATVCVMMALAAMSEVRAATLAGRSLAVRSAVSLRHLGLVWTWCALNLILTYGFVIDWPRWLVVFIVSLLAGGLCLFLSATLNEEDQQGSSDDRIVGIARAMAISQMVITAVALVGISLHLLRVKGLAIEQHSWAAMNFILFGALAIGAISWNVLLMEDRRPIEASPV